MGSSFGSLPSIRPTFAGICGSKHLKKDIESELPSYTTATSPGKSSQKHKRGHVLNDTSPLLPPYTSPSKTATSSQKRKDTGSGPAPSYGADRSLWEVREEAKRLNDSGQLPKGYRAVTTIGAEGIEVTLIPESIAQASLASTTQLKK